MVTALAEAPAFSGRKLGGLSQDVVELSITPFLQAGMKIVQNKLPIIRIFRYEGNAAFGSLDRTGDGCGVPRFIADPPGNILHQFEHHFSHAVSNEDAWVPAIAALWDGEFGATLGG